jgi:DNA-binding response OmpR family regulator
MKKRILCVEDDPDNRFLLECYLGLHDYVVISTSTAAEALKIISAEPFDVYILDTWLLDQSGVDLCRYICTLDLSAIVIFFSACAFPLDREQGIGAGAKEYLIKPNDFTKLPEVIAHYLKQSLSSKDHSGSGIELIVQKGRS